MTTKEIRQSVKDVINGKQMAGPDDDPFELPMTFGEAVRKAKGHREELGLSGSLIITVQHYSDAGDYETLEWQAFYHGDVHRLNVKCATPEAMILELRAGLERISKHDLRLDSIGAPSLAVKEGAA